MIHRLITTIASVVALTVITGMLIGALLLGILYASYRFIVSQGLEPGVAMLCVGLVTALITVITGLLALQNIRKLTSLPKNAYAADNPFAGLTSKAATVVDAFVNGLMTPVQREVHKTDLPKH